MRVDYQYFLEATVRAAIAAAKSRGKGDSKASDAAAVDEMRAYLNGLSFRSRVIIGEGVRDNAPMLFRGEVLGIDEGELCCDVAVDPLECTDCCAGNKNGAISVVAVSDIGGLLEADDVYMYKIVYAVNDAIPHEVDADTSLEDILSIVATSKGKKISELCVCILNRKRHHGIIKLLREMDVTVSLIDDGDVLASIMAVMPDFDIDIYVGVGGAPEGVISAAAIKGLGGVMHAKMLHDISSETEIDKALLKQYRNMTLSDLSKDESAVFIATGITDNAMMKGVIFEGENVITESIVIEVATSKMMKIQIKKRAK
ncbi:Fructose-1,6-bisphosphatase 1 class 2 [Candidatus Fokinia solitaria]|uniref:Fructose-1,6-bisphosphatase n=1 Tax=Candidatus Fokinia solitaria TaxID=1802984 RepID=A0A2U8BS68_9RICK|nr:fructose-bisphosphatase class II [Candidatus Fokinia solitaria]AWD33153.1 Fructose-1,6-bisphosphatase 1 class 2 [Candidatus Fokinia solitaria]